LAVKIVRLLSHCQQQQQQQQQKAEWDEPRLWMNGGYGLMSADRLIREHARS